MIIEFDCEVCGIHKRVHRTEDAGAPRFCSFACKVEGIRRQPLLVTYEWLHQKYIVEGLGCPEIGKLVDRDGSTVRHWLLKYGIPTRPRGSDVRQQFKKGVATNKGIKHTEEAKQKIGEASRQRKAVPYLRNGQHWLKTAPREANPKWKGGITPERQSFQKTEEWKKVSAEVWIRDEAKCRHCGIEHAEGKRKFHIHHIVNFKVKELRADPDNLVLLCSPCHRFVHSRANVDRLFLSPANVDSPTSAQVYAATAVDRHTNGHVAEVLA